LPVICCCGSRNDNNGLAAVLPSANKILPTGLFSTAQLSLMLISAMHNNAPNISKHFEEEASREEVDGRVRLTSGP